MQEVNEQSWLSNAISYLADELSYESKDAFVKILNQNSEYAEKFRILKKIWRTNFNELEEIRDSNSGWEKLKLQINQEIALKYYLRKVNMEKFDKKSVSMLHCIDNGLENNGNCNAEKIINALFIDDKPQFVAPQNDLWDKIAVEISKTNGSKKKLKPISTRKAIDTSNPRSRSIYFTAIAAIAAVIMLFLIIFVFMPENTSKIAKDEDSTDNDNVIIVPDPKNNILKNDGSSDDPDIDYPPEPEERKVSNPDEIIDNDTNEKTEIPKDKDTPENNIKNPEDNKTPDNENKKDPVIKDDSDTNSPKETPDKKIDSNQPKKNFKTEEFVFRAKYDEFDPEKIESNMPEGFGIQLKFSFNADENKFNVYELPLPTKDAGFKVTIDSNNNLHLDLNNDGAFDKTLTKSSYRDFKLQYDENSKRRQYRLKFVRRNNTWEILPACGLIAKNTYKDSELMIIDANLNGYFNDMNTDFYRFDDNDVQILSTVNLKGESWIKIRPDKAGTSIKILEYDLQNAGILQIDSFYREDVTLRWISIVGNSTAITVKSENIQEMLLPEGDYRISKGIVGDGKTEIAFDGNPVLLFKVFSGKTTIIKLGGELHLRISKHRYLDGKLSIDRNDIVIYGQSGEKYHSFVTKNEIAIPNIINSYLTKEDDFEFKILLTIQGLEGENIIFIKIPLLSEPGVYIVNFIEKKFSEFLSGTSVTSSTMKITRH